MAVYVVILEPAKSTVCVLHGFLVQFTDIDRDVLKAKRLLENLDEDKLKDLFRVLGLSDTSVCDKYSKGVSVYADDLVRSWILERDAVLESEVYLGGATWENLKKALIELKHIGIASKIV